MKNIVFLMNIKLNDSSGRYTPTRSYHMNFQLIVGSSGVIKITQNYLF